MCQEMFGLNYLIFRPHNVYGERQNIGDKYRNVIGIFMNQIMQGKPLTVFGDGKQTRAFSYIKDVSRIMAGSIRVPPTYNDIFNVGTDDVCTVTELAKKVCEVMGVKPDIQYLDERNEVKHAYSSHEKIRRIFGAERGYALEDGLRRMAVWSKGVGSRQSKRFENVEIGRASCRERV